MLLAMVHATHVLLLFAFYYVASSNYRFMTFMTDLSCLLMSALLCILQISRLHICNTYILQQIHTTVFTLQLQNLLDLLGRKVQTFFVQYVFPLHP